MDEIKRINPNAKTFTFKEMPDMDLLLKFLEKGIICEIIVGDTHYIMDKHMKYEFSGNVVWDKEALDYFVGKLLN